MALFFPPGSPAPLWGEALRGVFRGFCFRTQSRARVMPSSSDPQGQPWLCRWGLLYCLPLEQRHQLGEAQSECSWGLVWAAGQLIVLQL